ncbi:putative uncharacterized protein DDB_G0268364 [Drosophila novamexicana]|uniref:putative uncharacterized protein DDB_G0268364 n=1 Tax=Drosophila novamexicana TaxID=47314 RepID=UPI0011E5B075|nr:putative uncharacterized protein DDB_G0268364 [Drosophila novamexicana]XP_030558867.1 putative uncharacterized protein DDB_G0268364 [Drosophila novamexicana]
MLMPRYSEQDSHSDNSFAGKHGHASTTVAAHTKMRLLSKVEQNMRQNQQNNPNQNSGQNQSINKLIHTAATGNGLVGDVDELLTPMRIKAQAPQAMAAGIANGSGSGCSSAGESGGKETHSRPERNLWSRAEMLEMLNIMQEMNALEQLNDRNVKSEHVFRQIEEVMRSKGYVKKSSIQIWTKWKFLKSTYNTTTRHGNGIPKVVPEEVYRVLCRMLREHASVCGSISGISSECGNSRDSYNAELGRILPNNDDGGKEELGVEHPIFGFRLGLVKPEPLDTGYETTVNHANSSEQELESVNFVQMDDQTQSLEHTPFMMNVKHEPEMDLGMDSTNTPPPTAPTSPSPPPTSQEQRDLGDKSPLYPTKSQSVSMPPLRVAAFANDAQRQATSTPTHGILQIERPVAPLGKSIQNGGPGRGNRTMPLHSTSSINFVHPTSKLMLPRKQLPMRIPREISVQPANTRPLKPVPMRETGYSLRPDRMIPDLEQSISPPQSPSPPMHSQLVPKYNNPYASTSRQAQLLSEQQQQQPLRKRRLQFPQQTTPVPVKLQRSSTIFENNKQHGSFQSEDESAAEEHKTKLLAEEAKRRKEQQDEVFKKELTQLASAVRQAQKEMLQNFFQQQKQFARREHEFQLKQDNLVMSALRKQTDALLRTAKQLMQSEEEEEEVAECPLASKTEQQQQQTEDRSSNILLLQPEIELQEEFRKHEDAETLQIQDHDHGHDNVRDHDQDHGCVQAHEQFEEEAQYSNEENQSEAAMESSMSADSEDAGSEDASSQSASPSEAQIC